MTTRAILLAASLTLVACSVLAPQPDHSRFYKLTPLSGADVARDGTAHAGLLLGIGPVTVPGYLERPQLATRVGPNQVQFSADARWSESLDTDLAQVLARNVSLLVGTDQVMIFPWFGATIPSLAVAVDVEQFERIADGSVRLAARWAIRDPASRKLLAVHDTVIDGPGPPADDAATVAMLSGVLSSLSREIADAIRAVGPSAGDHGPAGRAGK